MTTRQPPALPNPLHVHVHVHVYAAQVVRMLQSCTRQQVFEGKRLFKLHVHVLCTRTICDILKLGHIFY